MVTSRRFFLSSAALAAAGFPGRAGFTKISEPPLEEFGYGDVTLGPGLAQTQFEQTQMVLLSLNEDALLKPWRLRAGLPAPGPELGGWYDEVPLQKTESGGHGFAPAHCFGQWISALARGYAITQDPATKARLDRLLGLYEPAILGRFYKNFRFPAYNYDKMVIGLLDAQYIAGRKQAAKLLELTTNAAEPHLPPRALDRDAPQRRWRESVGENTSNEYTWDESYTLPENLYLAWRRGAGERYRKLAERFLLDENWFDPLSQGTNVLPNHHAYSFCNSLSSAMQAYLADGSQKHLRAAYNAFDMIASQQSFATGGWGPNESFVNPGRGELYASLNGTHRGFETPCGSYAHLKLTRYLLRVTRDARYGDSMERVFYNTVLGAKQLQLDGRAFYYSDYHTSGRKTYFSDAWPCCSGTLPQVAADYRVLAYFRDRGGIFVNLYLPSTVRWTSADGAQLTLEQTGDYPFSEKIELGLRASRSSTFNISLRIPAWTGGRPGIRVNGQTAPTAVRAGFASIERRWEDGDQIELRLPISIRLEAIDDQHPGTVAVVRGPMVLFAMTNAIPKVQRKDLMTIVHMPEKRAWRAETYSGPILFRPFVEIEDEPYVTYLNMDA